MFGLTILALLSITVHQTSGLDCENDVALRTFDCQIQSKNVLFSLMCSSAITDPNEKTYFILEIEWKEKNISNNFKKLLSNEFHSPTTSRLNQCDISWKRLLSAYPALLLDQCKNRTECFDRALKFINESSVTKVEITGVEDSSFLTSLDQFPAVNVVNIYDFSHLNLTEVKLSGLTLLHDLQMVRDDIEYLPDGIFSSLKELETLDLSQNKIREITNYTFGSVYNLKVLNLSFNSISVFSKNALSGMNSLQEIYLNNNKLLSIHEEFLSFIPNLAKVSLSDNSIKSLPKQIFKNLFNLVEVECSNCKLVELDDDLFRNSTKLQSVDLSRNEIRQINNKVFENQVALVYLNMSCNRLQELPKLGKKSYLRFIGLAQNEISNLDEIFSSEIKTLYYLDLSGNKLKTLNDLNIKNFLDLEHCDLSRNEITTVELGLTTDVFIRKLKLSNNRIKTLKVDWRRFVFLEALEMDYNLVESIELPPCIPSVKQTITFSFQYNKITRLDTTSLMEDQKRLLVDRTMAGCLFNGGSKNFVDFSNNPLFCDCNLYPFYDYLQQKNQTKLDTFLNEESLICSGPDTVKNKSLIDLPKDALSCFFNTSCPRPCTCGIRGKDSKVFLNCSGTKITEIPQVIPKGTTVFYFNRNNLTEIVSLNDISSNNLTEIHANNNNLTTLDGWQFPEKLQFLSLKYNKLRNLPQQLMDFIGNQSSFQLFLSGNDQNCNCSSKSLKDFLRHHQSFVKDTENVVCEMDNNNGTKSLLPLYTIPDSMLCAETVLLSFNPKATIISMSVTFVVLLSILLIYYKQRQLILSFLYIHCDEVFHVCFEENETDDDKLFDAFIAYSSSDRHIVMNMLHELEEKEPHFQLCIHERNWLPGRFISDNIMNSVQSSKRTIIILSDSFIASPWFRLELRAAIFKVSGDKRNKMIVILADKATSLDVIDTEIRHVITKRTYLVWGERWFWEKLRYAMPRSSCLEISEENQISENRICKRDSEMTLMEEL